MVSRKTIYDNSRKYIWKALEGTLERIKRDYIDIYTIHYRDYSVDIAEVVGTLEEFRKEGKVRYFGLSNIHKDSMAELIPFRCSFVNCQDEYSLACRKYEGNLEKVAQELSVTPLTWGSLGQGILTGKYNKENVNFRADDRRSRDGYVNFHGRKLEKNLEIVEKMRSVDDAHEKSVSAVATRFILDHIDDSVVLAGFKNKQLKATIDASDWKLTEEELDMLDRVSGDVSGPFREVIEQVVTFYDVSLYHGRTSISSSQTHYNTCTQWQVSLRRAA